MKIRSNQTSQNSFFNEIACLVTCILRVQILNLKGNMVPHDIIKADVKLTRACLND